MLLGELQMMALWSWALCLPLMVVVLVVVLEEGE